MEITLRNPRAIPLQGLLIVTFAKKMDTLLMTVFIMV